MQGRLDDRYTELPRLTHMGMCSLSLAALSGPLWKERALERTRSGGEGGGEQSPPSTLGLRLETLGLRATGSPTRW